MAEKVGGIEFDVTVDTSGTALASAKVDAAAESMGNSLSKVDAATKKTSNNLKMSGRNMSYAMGQAGNQIADFAVQVEMGTSPMRAFTQQGSQMAAMFGPAGMVVGAIIGVAGALISTLIPSFGKSGKAIDDLVEKLKELGKIEDLTAEQQALLDMANKKSVEETNKKIESIKKEIAENENLNKSRQGKIDNPSRGQMGGVAAQKALKEQIKETNDELVFQRAQLATYNQELGNLTEPEKKKTEALLSGLKERQLLIDTFQQIKSNQEAGAYSNEVANEKMQFAAKVAQMQESHKEMMELAGANQEAINLVRDIQFSETEMAHADHQARITAIEEAEAKRRLQLAEQEQRVKMTALGGAFKNLSALMNTESRKMFEVGKAAAIAGALVDAYAAVTGAYKVGSKIGGPPLGAAYAAAAGVAQAVNIANIAKQKMGGAQSMGATQSFSGGVPVQNTASQQNQQVDVYLSGDNFSRAGIAGLVSTLNEYFSDGGTTLNVKG